MSTTEGVAGGRLERRNGARPGVTARGVAAALKSRIARWELPDGHRLVEEQLAVEFGVSRSPVREALRSLAADGYVEIVPRAGYRVRQPSLEDIRDLYELRLALELMVVDKLAESAGAGEPLDAVRGLRELDDHQPLGLLDRSFHEGLAQAAGNQAIIAALDSINDRLVVFRELEAEVAERMELTDEQHAGVLEAILRGDRPAAAIAIRTNITGALDGIEHQLGAALVRGMNPSRPNGSRPTQEH
ncbi:MAG: GntR family transcriptional regulator [Acidimicrobiales bacterium]